MKSRTSVPLSGNDCCVVFKENGEVEFVGPEGKKGDPVPPNVVVMLGVAEHLLNVEFCEDMMDFMAGAAGCDCPKCRFAKDVAPGGAVH